MDPPFRIYTFKMLSKLIIEITKNINSTVTILKKEDLLAFNEVNIN